MTKERAYEIAKKHIAYEVGTVSFFPMADGRNLHVQTLFEPSYFDNDDLITYIDAENEDGDALESHTTHNNNVIDIAFWIHQMFYNVEERGE